MSRLSNATRALVRPRRNKVVLIVLLVVALIASFTVLGGYTSTSGGEAAVVRNGGPFDDNRVRVVLDPSSRRTWIGIGSQVHRYPAQQRFFTITTDAKRASTLGVDTLTISSNDGVSLGIEGTLYFSLNRDHRVLRDFDDRYGTRRFRGQDNEMRYPWAGEDGWTAFFGQAVRPVIDNSLRTQISGFRCADLVPSCAFMQQDPTKPRGLITNEESKANFTRIQEAINTSLTGDIERTLGAPYLTGFRFTLTRITLPPEIQKAINEGQAAMAQLYKAQADVRRAQALAAADKARQEGYRACPVCAEIDKRNGQR
ncbi:SPFH domain-containing protein [Actinomadura craniellae]|uniref:SPFH domain-containing protein n=1 Tax=Actinomadura craniellae TaxID=2231787 RepID=A0A365GVK8_9ACTN|nr:SPFH domain-containing protein [Actinomadura craniellae]RAY10861.1 SPFH domain-containing protein [Actinomadura craniellae]